MDQNLAIIIAVSGGAFVLILGGLWKIAYEWPRFFGRVAPFLQGANFGAIMGLLGFNQGIYLANVYAPDRSLTELAVSPWWALIMIGAMIYIFCLGRFVTRLKPKSDKFRRKSSRSGQNPAAS